MLPSVYTAKAYGLFVDGLDVLKEPAVPVRYGVEASSINVLEAGPGGVSTMSFTIDDPSLLITIATGAEVRYWDLTNNWPIFLGYVERVAIAPAFGQQGRSIDISAYGIESLLDSVIVPAMTRSYLDTDSNSGQFRYDDILQVFASYAPLRAFMSATPATASSQALPIANSATLGLGFGVTFVVDGMTIRQAMEGFIAACGVNAGPQEGNLPPSVLLTVDFYGGVRSWLWLDAQSSGYGVANPGFPTDWTVLTLTDTSAGAVAAENISYELDTSPGAIVNAVYVKGASAAGTGWFVGDTRSGRHEAYVTSSATTYDALRATASAILGTKAVPPGRGSFDLTSFTPINNHPGGSVIITDARLGWASRQGVITEIAKRFEDNGKQQWHVSFVLFGDGPSAGAASGTRSTRTYTRSTMN